MQLPYNPSEYQPSQGFEALPAADYMAMVSSIDYAYNKAGTGQMAKITYDIIDGKYSGRKIFTNENFVHTNADAERIGREHIAALQTAVDCYGSNELNDVMNKPLIIKLNVKNDPQYGPQNNVVNWSKVETGFSAGSTPNQQQNAGMPWAK